MLKNLNKLLNEAQQVILSVNAFLASYVALPFPDQSQLMSDPFRVMQTMSQYSHDVNLLAQMEVKVVTCRIALKVICISIRRNDEVMPRNVYKEVDELVRVSYEVVDLTKSLRESLSSGLAVLKQVYQVHH